MKPSLARGLRVSVVVGVIAWRDAISNICLQQVDALTRHARRHGYPLAVKVYTTSTQETEARIAPHTAVASIAADPHFLESDVAIYHFGIYTPLFDTIHLAGPMTRKIVCYYGITFPTLLNEDQREVMFYSYQQAVNLHVADRVLVTSSFLRCELARMGVPDARIIQIAPAIPFTIPATTPRRVRDEDLRLLYVGRFVRAKGVLDLLRAVAVFCDKTGQRIRLDLVGSKTFSDRHYIDQLDEFVRDAGLADHVCFHFDAPTAHLVRLLGQAHVLVIPSYHEGYCVPVLEALACGCFVICSDAGALPETSNGLGRTFAVADANQLASRLEEYIAARRRGGFQTDRGFLTVDEWERQTRQYVTDLSPARCDARFCNAVLADLPAVDPDLRSVLAQRRRQLLLDLHGGPIPVPQQHGPEFRVNAALAGANVGAA
jgi:glycosyltransferase involved in cell wall biosynthesis